MNWGSIPIKLEPWNSNGPLYSHYHFATYENEYVTGDGPSSNELDTNHQRTNERANERVTMKKNEDDLVKNNKKDTKYKRYHPYKEKKCFKENAGQSIARNRIEKDRRSARRILEEHLGQPLLGRFEEVFRRYTVSVDVHGRKFFGTGHTFTAARNDAAENALKTIGQR